MDGAGSEPGDDVTAPAGLPGDPPFPGDLPSGCPFHPRCPRVEDRCSATEPELLAIDDHMTACLVAQDEAVQA